MKICIDPGHGGHDPGACNGPHQEKVYAFAIAKKLGTLLKQKGHDVFYTRNSDAYISLTERCNIANKGKADLFISIHLNSAASSIAKGIETFCYSENSKGWDLAKEVQNSLIAVTGAVNRGVKIGSGLAVVRGTHMPSILIETGFISNKSDLLKLVDNEYEDALANAICIGVQNYLGVKETSTEKKKELTSANDITWELNHTYFHIEDDVNFVKALEEAKNSNSPLYWGYYKLVNGK